MPPRKPKQPTDLDDNQSVLTSVGPTKATRRLRAEPYAANSESQTPVMPSESKSRGKKRGANDIHDEADGPPRKVAKVGPCPVCQTKPTAADGWAHYESTKKRDGAIMKVAIGWACEKCLNTYIMHFYMYGTFEEVGEMYRDDAMNNFKMTFNIANLRREDDKDAPPIDYYLSRCGMLQKNGMKGSVYFRDLTRK